MEILFLADSIKTAIPIIPLRWIYSPKDNFVYLATLKIQVIQSAKLQINGDTHDEVMLDNCVERECPLPLILFSLHIDDLETYLDEIDGDSPCLFNMVVVILLYVEDVVMLSKSRASKCELYLKIIDTTTMQDYYCLS